MEGVQSRFHDVNIYQPKEYFECSDALYQEYADYQSKIDKLKNEQKEFRDKIKSIVKRCNTLKQFLQVWPQGENLVPENVLKKYHAPTEKRVNPAEEIEIDDSLSAALIRRKVINAGNK